VKLTHLLAVCAIMALASLSQTQSVDAQGCPPNSAPVSESGNIVHCRCIEGYVNRGGACVPVLYDPQEVIKRINAHAMELGWSAEKLWRLNKSLNDLVYIFDPSVTNYQLDHIWKNLKASSQDEGLAQKANLGFGPGMPGSGTQTGHNDCAIFALANAAQLPYGVVAARAGELLRAARWRTAEDRSDPRKTIERDGLIGGEVIMMAEAFGRAEVVAPSNFGKALKDGKTVLVNVRHKAGTPPKGHEVVLTKTFQHSGSTWYEMMDSYQGPLKRLYVSDKDLNSIIIEKGVTYSPDLGSVPWLLR
jgi:hypothetical protein